MVKKCKILMVVSGKEEPGWSRYSSYFANDLYEWDYCFLNTEKTRQMLCRIFFINKKMQDYDIVISCGIGYCIAFAVALRLNILGRKAYHVHHIAYSFVQTRRLFKTKYSFINNIINNIFNRCSVFVTHSMEERKLLSDAHNLPIEKFHFTHWAIKLPTIEPTIFSNWKKPYVCCIGRVNRDFDTFIKGLEGIDIDGIIITPFYNMQKSDLKTSNQISLFNDLTMNECLDCIKNSVANIVLVNHGWSGAGHITIVVSMLLGKPQIISDVETIKDYFINKLHGVTIPIRDHLALKASLNSILSNSSDDYRRQSSVYASKWFTEERASKDLKMLIDNLMAGLPISPYDQVWKTEYELLTSDSNL